MTDKERIEELERELAMSRAQVDGLIALQSKVNGPTCGAWFLLGGARIALHAVGRVVEAPASLRHLCENIVEEIDRLMKEVRD